MPYFFVGRRNWRSSSIICAGWRAFTPHKENDRIGSRTGSVYGKASMRQLHRNPIAVSGSGHTGKKINSFDAAIHMQESPPSQAVLRRMQLTLHATRRTTHGSSRLVLAMSAWSAKIRRNPPRHCRDARVYGHTTTAMHHTEYTPGAAGCL